MSMNQGRSRTAVWWYSFCLVFFSKRFLLTFWIPQPYEIMKRTSYCVLEWNVHSEIHHLPLFRPNSFKLFPSSMLKLSETREIFEVLISQILAIQFENQPRKFLAKTMASLWSFYSKWGWNDSSFFAAFSWTWERVVSHFLPIYSTYGSLATVCLNYLKLCSRWNDKWSCYD